jgi:hypothetical protein
MTPPAGPFRCLHKARPEGASPQLRGTTLAGPRVDWDKAT